MFVLRKTAPFLGFATLAVLGTAARPAAAQTFMVTFTGVITAMDSSTPTPIPDPWGVGVQVGTPFTETFTWDRSLAGGAISSALAIWQTQNIAQGAVITVGGVRITPFQTTPQDATGHDYEIRTFEYNGNGPGKPPGVAFLSTGGLMTGADSRLQYQSVETGLVSRSPAVTVSLTDPGAAWLNPALDQSEFTIFAMAPSQSEAVYGLSGQITGVTGSGLTPAPEPSQAAFLTLGALGLAGLGLKARGRKDRHRDQE